MNKHIQVIKARNNYVICIGENALIKICEKDADNLRKEIDSALNKVSNDYTPTDEEIQYLLKYIISLPESERYNSKFNYGIMSALKIYTKKQENKDTWNSGVESSSPAVRGEERLFRCDDFNAGKVKPKNDLAEMKHRAAARDIKEAVKALKNSAGGKS